MNKESEKENLPPINSIFGSDVKRPRCSLSPINLSSLCETADYASLSSISIDNRSHLYETTNNRNQTASLTSISSLANTTNSSSSSLYLSPSRYLTACQTSNNFSTYGSNNSSQQISTSWSSTSTSSSFVSSSNNGSHPTTNSMFMTMSSGYESCSIQSPATFMLNDKSLSSLGSSLTFAHYASTPNRYVEFGCSSSSSYNSVATSNSDSLSLDDQQENLNANNRKRKRINFHSINDLVNRSQSDRQSLMLDAIRIESELKETRDQQPKPIVQLNDENKEEEAAAAAVVVRGDSNKNPQKRKRTTLAPKQKEILDEAFQMKKYPEPTDLERICRQTSLDEYTVRIWFQNQRARTKLRQKRSDFYNN